VVNRNHDAKMVQRRCVVLQPALQAALTRMREKAERHGDMDDEGVSGGAAASPAGKPKKR
jgi:hypothetical protein